MSLSEAMSRDERVLSLLGGSQLLQISADELQNPAVVTRLMRRGLPIQSAVHARGHMGVKLSLFDTVLPRTTLNSARKRQAPLTTSVSETVYRMARIKALAEEAFGDPGRAGEWLSTPNPVFEDEAPLALTATESGAEWVGRVLIRMMHGVNA